MSVVSDQNWVESIVSEEEKFWQKGKFYKPAVKEWAGLWMTIVVN